MIFDLDRKKARLQELQEIMAAPGFWDDPATAQRVTREVSQLEGVLERWTKLDREVEDLKVLHDLAVETGDEGEAAEIERTLARLTKEAERWELSLLLDGEYDDHNAILAIHPGAGGTEAQDWAEMLLRMYTRWAEERGYKVEMLDLLPGDEAGIKSATLSIEGPNAYGYLKSEKGVHRLVRISPFDQAARRHTSFASVEVLPELESENEVEINPEDLKIDTFRSGGAGGQHVNKTESAIRITHLPTGIVVTCQNERSQFSNRDTAMKILQARLLERKLAEQQEKLAELRGEHGDIAWGNQIRSYVFCPYTMVKDHRTNYETGNVNAVMDGDLDPFIDAYLRQRKQAKA
ncbi:MAG TPA: peptide chain release factor 2 [Firmicutes bacterium]|nr:peptide chain release factor 2 [Bacillota bacterium]